MRTRTIDGVKLVWGNSRYTAAIEGVELVWDAGDYNVVGVAGQDIIFRARRATLAKSSALANWRCWVEGEPQTAFVARTLAECVVEARTRGWLPPKATAA